MKNKTEAPLNQEVTVWYKHSPKSDLKFSKKVSTPESAKAIIDTTFRVMQHLNRADQITGGYVVTDSKGEKLQEVTLDGSVSKATSQAGEPKEGDLRLWYAHNISSSNLLYSEISSPEKALSILPFIYELMLFLYDNNQILDYCNAGGLEVYEDDGEGGLEWCEWYSDDGFDISEILAVDLD